MLRGGGREVLDQRVDAAVLGASWVVVLVSGPFGGSVPCRRERLTAAFSWRRRSRCRLSNVSPRRLAMSDLRVVIGSAVLVEAKNTTRCVHDCLPRLTGTTALNHIDSGCHQAVEPRANVTYRTPGIPHTAHVGLAAERALAARGASSAPLSGFDTCGSAEGTDDDRVPTGCTIGSDVSAFRGLCFTHAGIRCPDADDDDRPAGTIGRDAPIGARRSR